MPSSWQRSRFQTREGDQALMDVSVMLYSVLPQPHGVAFTTIVIKIERENPSESTLKTLCSFWDSNRTGVSVGMGVRHDGEGRGGPPWASALS